MVFSAVLVCANRKTDHRYRAIGKLGKVDVANHTVSLCTYCEILIATCHQVGL